MSALHTTCGPRCNLPVRRSSKFRGCSGHAIRRSRSCVRPEAPATAGLALTSSCCRYLLNQTPTLYLLPTDNAARHTRRHAPYLSLDIHSTPAMDCMLLWCARNSMRSRRLSESHSQGIVGSSLWLTSSTSRFLKACKDAGNDVKPWWRGAYEGDNSGGECTGYC